MRKVLLSLLVIFLMISYSSLAQEDSTKTDNAKKGWSFGAVPVVAYDSDIGFKYGGLVNLYDYGDGTIYPGYKHSIYLEWSRTTKGSGINQFTYDSEYLIPGLRTQAEVSLLTEQALDFYGFNGARVVYNPLFEDDSDGNADYLSRLYYRHSRQLFRTKLDFQGKLKKDSKKIRWMAGAEFYGAKIDMVDIDKLNEDKDPADMLSDTSLYTNYVNWGAIKADQAEGGRTTYLKAGLIYDTRDNEPNPNKGIWEEALIYWAPPGINDYSYSRLILSHRHYLTLWPKKMTFAYRLSYQAKLSGEMPFYMLPFVYDTKLTRDGMGGSKTIRGVLRNRLVGEDIAFANFEVRYKIINTVIAKQNFYIAFKPFIDMGRVMKDYDFDASNVPVDYLNDIDGDKLHISYGAGVHFAINENFIVTADYGVSASKDNGTTGLYIMMNFLF